MSIFNNLSHALNRELFVAQKGYLYFGGTAYLGIPQHQEFKNIFIEGLNLYGISNGTSRNNNVQLGIYNEAEECAAQRFGANATLITSSGYLAAQLAVKELSKNKEVRYAPDTHPSLWGVNRPYNTLNFRDWSARLIEEINNSQKEKWLIICNAINNLIPERYDFSFVTELKKDITLIVDDSHGIGIINHGLGILPQLPKQPNVKSLVVASMAKALGIDAGIVLGDNDIIQQLKSTNEFLGASPPAAAGLYAFMHGESIYKKQLEKLKYNINYFIERIDKQEDWRFLSDFPVFLCQSSIISEKFAENKILISSFAYPDQNSPILNRVVLSSWHQTNDIDKVCNQLK